MSRDISPEMAKCVIETELSLEVSNQPAELEKVNVENGTVGAFFSDRPNIHKHTTDMIELHGWKLSGIVGDTLYFRQIDE